MIMSLEGDLGLLKRMISSSSTLLIMVKGDGISWLRVQVKKFASERYGNFSARNNFFMLIIIICFIFFDLGLRKTGKSRRLI
jgi:hypothetical protein